MYGEVRSRPATDVGEKANFQDRAASSLLAGTFVFSAKCLQSCKVDHTPLYHMQIWKCTSTDTDALQDCSGNQNTKRCTTVLIISIDYVLTHATYKILGSDLQY